jgi:hypothetical protein
MLIDAVRRALVRDLGGLAVQLEGYPDDASVWALPVGFANSTGTLTLHACGNLRHFIGGVLGASGYVRDRNDEFASRDLPRVELEMLIAVTRDEVSRALEHLDSDMLPMDYPLPINHRVLSTGAFLVHLATHLAYHLGQADIHRRIVTGNAAGVGMMSPVAMTDAIAQ